MELITATYAKLSDDGDAAALNHLNAAIYNIDSKLGNGYAADHPELICAMMKVAAIDTASMVLGKCMQESSVVISKQISDLVSSVVFFTEK
jgi:hypothetical protein